MSELVEKVARAMLAASPYTQETRTPFDKAPPEFQEGAREDARIAIALILQEMAEPSEGMIDEAAKVYGNYGEEDAVMHRSTFRAMLSAFAAENGIPKP